MGIQRLTEQHQYTRIILRVNKVEYRCAVEVDMLRGIAGQMHGTILLY